jgi:DNA-binding NtrC family response regulator
MAEDFEGDGTHVLTSSAAAAAPTLPGVELVVVEGPDAGARVRVDGGVCMVGTARGAGLRLVDRAVSRMHCEVTVRPGSIALTDGGSTNGTFVDGRRVRDIDLAPGTVVRVGGSSFRVDVGGPPAALQLSQRASFGDMVGSSVAMRRVYSILERVAPTESTVLVLGETGTGKELAARAIHDGSARRAGPFIPVDCGAIPEHLVESELFGHVRGAFTGAVSDRRGVFEEAAGGTLFLDEIGELPLTMQPKLLRALETRSVRRVGANRPVGIDCRVVAATHRSLHRSVNQGTFREDLYYRLAVVEVELPPLRERVEDIPAIAAHLLERYSGVPTAPSPEMLSAFAVRPWPGNVRELRNVIERSVSLGWATTADSLGRAGPTAAPASLGAAEVPVHLPLKEARQAWTEQFESVYLHALLARSGGNVTHAAAMAGVNRRFLQRMMARLGVRDGADGSEPD